MISEITSYERFVTISGIFCFQFTLTGFIKIQCSSITSLNRLFIHFLELFIMFSVMFVTFLVRVCQKLYEIHSFLKIS